MLKHMVVIGLICLMIGTVIVYPFLPGSYDAMAVPLSAMCQLLVIFGTLFIVPPASIWLVSEFRCARTSSPVPPHRVRSMLWPTLTFFCSMFVAAVLVLLSLVLVGLAFACVSFALAIGSVTKARKGLRQLRTQSAAQITMAPLYLIAIPLAVLVFELLVFRRATDFSRQYAMEQAAVLIHDLEAWKKSSGDYPASMAAVHPDYKLGVVGIDGFQYAKHGKSFKLAFEQPRFLVDELGTREFVVYNPSDDRFMISHAAWYLQHPLEFIESNQGWRHSEPADMVHWHRFMFD